jgi:3-oxoacyl-[acyl-carrier-protein] synthase II
MSPPVRVSGIGIARTDGAGAEETAGVARRLSAVLAALSWHGTHGRLVHPIEEMALLAAHDALRRAGVRTPLGGEDIGVALGLEEGIDGIKAQYYRDILRDGPLGASPIVFPLTTPNTIAARISIALDLRGENLTLCAGTLSGAHALGLAMEMLRAGRMPVMLAGGATSVQGEFLDALSVAGGPEGGSPGCGACLFLLRFPASAAIRGEAGRLLGYAQAVGRDDVRAAIQACLQDAELAPAQVGSVHVAAAHESRSLVASLRGLGVGAPVVRSPSAGLHSASFPLAVAEALGQAADGSRGPALVVGSDCLVGAAAAIVHGDE